MDQQALAPQEICGSELLPLVITAAVCQHNQTHHPIVQSPA
jgi:hypothetical protein